MNATLPVTGLPVINWAISDRPADYSEAIAAMNARASAIRQGTQSELVWLLEHPPLYTAGTGAKRGDLLMPDLLPVFQTGRGGQFTYHGPGQRVVYLMLNLKQRGNDVRGLITTLEAWIIDTLDVFNLKCETRPGRVGVWVQRSTRDGVRDDKIAALGLRISGGVTTHGISINVEPNLSHYRGIVPCGIQAHGVTSLADLGLPVTLADVDIALRRSFEKHFGPVDRIEPPPFAA